MVDYLSLLKDTLAYKTVLNDKAQGKINHAYLILSKDGDSLGETLKVISKLLVCKNTPPCTICREEKMVEEGVHSDVLFFPKKKDRESIVVEDIEELIDETYYKPTEGGIKILAVVGIDKATPSAQNKLLKTLEEPPKNVVILLGATSEFPILSTIKSRSKKLEINSFSDEQLFSALEGECGDRELLKTAIACSDKTVGKTLALYGDKNMLDGIESVKDFILNLQSSRDVLEFTGKLAKLKCEFSDFLELLEGAYIDMLRAKTGEERLVKNMPLLNGVINAKGYTVASIISAIESITECKKRLKLNANRSMINEWLCFSILEGKHKWQKL